MKPELLSAIRPNPHETCQLHLATRKAFRIRTSGEEVIAEVTDWGINVQNCYPGMIRLVTLQFQDPLTFFINMEGV
jgi:hypothetical protein